MVTGRTDNGLKIWISYTPVSLWANLRPKVKHLIAKESTGKSKESGTRLKINLVKGKTVITSAK
jgi:hypothetical protein